MAPDIIEHLKASAAAALSTALTIYPCQIITLHYITLHRNF